MAIVTASKRRRDWFVLLRALMRHGVSMNEVARRCGRNIGAVKHWADGGEPKESDARVILALLARVAPEEYAKDQSVYGIKIETEIVAVKGDQSRLAFVEVK